MTIEEALHEARKRMAGWPGVVGVGIGEKDDEPVIVIFVRADQLRGSHQDLADLPTHIGRYKVDIRPEIKVGQAAATIQPF